MNRVQHFQNIARHFPDPGFLLDARGVIVAANPAALRFTGLDAVQMTQVRLQDLVLNAPAKVEQYLAHCAQSELEVAGELTWRRGRHEGQRVPCEGALLFPAKVPGGELLLLRCELRKRAEADGAGGIDSLVMRPLKSDLLARAQHESLRVILSSIGDAVIATDVAGRVTFLNPAAEKLTGWPLAEAIDQPLSRVFRIVDEQTGRPLTLPTADELEREQRLSLPESVVLIDRSGVEHPIDESAAPISNSQGAIIGLVVVFHDVADRRHSEQVLRASEERFRLLVNNVQDYVIMMLGLDGTIVSWNEGAQRILGYSAEEILGQSYSRFFPPEDVLSGVPQQELRIATSTGRAMAEGWRVRKDGTQFWASGVNTALWDRAGRLRGFAKIMRDLTAAREMSEELRRQTDQLAEADRRKNEFLAMLGHELRNPLAAITNALNVKQLCLSDEDACRLADEVIGRQIELMSRLMDDLLDVSRITRGKIELRLAEVDLSKVVQAAVEAVRTQFNERAHTLKIELPEERVVFSADSARLEQILMNLLSNAAKYTDPGGEITISARREQDSIELRVRDTGVGIPPELLPHIFDLFTQADRSLDRSKGGLGIGLTLVRSLVEMHRGTIRAESGGHRQGSEFIVTLPLKPAEAPLKAAPKNRISPATPARKQRVLVVEDNTDIAKMISLMVQHCGHDVWVAHEGETALRLAYQHRPEVFLLDIGLPGMNGYELARRLRATGFENALVVAMTGYGQDEDRRRSQAAGFDEHLVKPIARSRLERLFEAPQRAVQQSPPSYRR